MRKKSYERKNQCCCRERSQQEVLWGFGRSDGAMVWEELAELELEDGPGLLESGVVTFVGMISSFSFLLTNQWVQPSLHSVIVGWDSTDVYHLARCQCCGSVPAYVPYATAFLIILFKQVWSLFQPVAVDESCGSSVFPCPFPIQLIIPHGGRSIPSAGPAQK